MNILPHKYSFFKHKYISVYLVCLILIVPNVIWAALDRSLWWGDRAGYALQSASVYINMTNSFLEWKGGLFNYYKAPMIFWVGEFFVPLGKLIGSVNFSLLLIPLIASYITLVLLFKSFELLFKNRGIAFCGCLIVASAPLFNALSRGFWIEPMQLAIISWFIYSLVKARSWSFYFSLSQFIIAISLAMLTKASSPIYIIITSIGFWVTVFTGAPSLRIDQKGVFFLAVSMLFFFPAAIFYVHNFNDILGFVHYAATNPLFGIGSSKLSLWIYAITNELFIAITFFPTLILILYGILKIIRHKVYSNFGSVFFVALLQITIFFIAWMGSPNNDTRYFLPILPYFAILVCWGLANSGSRIYTAIWIVIFFIQFTTVNGMAFGWININDESGLMRPLQRKPDDNSHIIQDIIPLATRDSSIIFDLNPPFGTCEFQYELAKQNLTGNWGKCCTDISAFFNIHRQEIDTGKINIDSAWKDFLSYNPDFYITWNSRQFPDSAEKEIRTIDKYNAVTVPMRWAIAERIKKSNLYEPVTLPSQRKLLIYKRRNLPMGRFKKVHLIQIENGQTNSGPS